MLLPVRCGVCGRVGASPCERCVGELRRAPPLPAPAGLDACIAFLEYEGAGADLVARLKYRNARGSLRWLAEAMAGVAVECGWAGSIDVVSWAPTTGARRRQRGFDQAELLARRVAQSVGRPARPLLRRRGDGHQTGRSRRDRLVGPCFDVRAGPAAPGRRILLVDDVVTTGATLSAAAVALRRAGAGSVVGLAAAHTPA